MNQLNKEREKISIQEMKKIVLTMRTIADTLEPTQPTEMLERTDSRQEHVNGTGSRSYKSMITNALDVVSRLLDTESGASAAVGAVDFIRQNHQAIFAAVKRFWKVLGPVTMFCSLALGICCYDYQKNQSVIDKQIDFAMINHQVQRLMESLETIRGLIEQVTQDAPLIVTEWFLSNSDYINNLFEQIEVQLKIANIRLSTAEELLEKIKTPMTRYRNKLLIRSTIVAFGFGAIAFGLRKCRIIDDVTTSAGVFIGVIPLCYFYFRLSIDKQEILVEVQRREMNNLVLKRELEIFELQTMNMKEERNQRAVNAGTGLDQHIR